MTIGLHAHHIRFWADGGATETQNLALLCRRHHKAVHEGGWSLTGDPDHPDGLTFTSPTGRTVTARPATCSDRVRARVVPDPPPPPTRPGPADRSPTGDHHAGCAHHAPAFRCAHLDAIRARLRREALRDLVDEGP
jgi:hypothetical protein